MFSCNLKEKNMRNSTVIFILLSFTFFSYSQNGLLQNGDFEQWESRELYKTPTDWRSSNSEDYTGESNLDRSNDSSDGLHSAYLSVKLSHGDTLGGYVFLGGIGQNGPDSGIDYSHNFNEVTLDYKCDLGVGDTLYYYVIRFDASMNMTGVFSGEISHSVQAEWENASISIPNGNQSYLFIAFVLNDPQTNYFYDMSSHATIDNIKLLNNGQQQPALPNNSFEHWGVTTLESPVQWYTFNPYVYHSGQQSTVKTTDAANGNFAIRISTITIEGSPVEGIISNSPVSRNLPYPWAPISYNATPTTISGNYKYTTDFNDNAFIQIEFFQLGNLIGSLHKDLTPEDNYTAFSEHLIINGAPDSMSLMAYSGDFEHSVLYLDDLSLSGGNVGLKALDHNTIKASPNPVNNTLNLTLPNQQKAKLKVFDQYGKLHLQYSTEEKTIKLNVSQLKPGVYYLEYFSINGINRTKIIKN